MPSHLTISERFWQKVTKTETCWLWQASTLGHGYGQFWNGSQRMLAHRYAYQTLVGPIPEGMHLDHLCRVTTCVNPNHLEPVTAAENNRRAFGERSMCRAGHEYNATNTYIWKDGRKYCRPCDARRHREKRALK